MSKEIARARFRQAVLDMRDVVRHGNQEVLNRHTDDALVFGDAYAAECVAEADGAEAREPLVAALQAVEWVREDELPKSIPWCPCCHKPHYHGHAPDCQLAAALAAKETL